MPLADWDDQLEPFHIQMGVEVPVAPSASMHQDADRQSKEFVSNPNSPLGRGGGTAELTTPPENRTADVGPLSANAVDPTPRQSPGAQQDVVSMKL
jgi:hypothetical protein